VQPRAIGQPLAAGPRTAASALQIWLIPGVNQPGQVDQKTVLTFYPTFDPWAAAQQVGAFGLKEFKQFPVLVNPLKNPSLSRAAKLLELGEPSKCPEDGRHQC
jgi:hypothetical protein